MSLHVMATKKSFLVVYDYGTGGVWALVKAASAEEIVRKYPVLTVVEERPAWMTDEALESIDTFDIGDGPPDWLALAIKEQLP